ncbi:MAG: cell division protein FtsA [Bdellovibrionales bacterium]
MAQTQSNSVIIAGLDIGTTKVACAIGQIGAEGLEIIGMGQAPNLGVRQGAVINIDITAEAIRKAKEEAELMAGQKISDVWLGVAGSHIESFDSSGMVAVRSQEVDKDDVERVIEAAKAIAIPSDRQVLHVLPTEYKVDNQVGINDPIGMAGVRLEASVHIITGAKSTIQNAIKCTEKAGLRVAGLALQQFASSLAVLSDDEKSLGVCVVDIGGGTSDMVAYSQGALIYTGVVPVGGQNFSHDIAMGLRTTQTAAENLKKKYGCALPDLIGADETIEVESVGGRQKRVINRLELCEIVEARAEETLKLIKEKIEQAGLSKRLGSGVIITGGVSQLTGLSEMGDFIFDVPVRKGIPTNAGGLKDIVKSPVSATVVGLLIYGAQKHPKQSMGMVGRK